MQSKPVAVFQILKAEAVLVSFNRRKNNNNKAPAVVLADNLEACSAIGLLEIMIQSLIVKKLISIVEDSQRCTTSGNKTLLCNT